MKLLSEKIEGGIRILKYEKEDGSITSIELAIGQSMETEPRPESRPSLIEQLLAETQYQTAIIEMNMMGGM